MNKLKQTALITLAFSSGLIAGNYEKPIVYDESNPHHLIAKAIEANIAFCEVTPTCDLETLENMRREWESYYNKI